MRFADGSRRNLRAVWFRRHRQVDWHKCIIHRRAVFCSAAAEPSLCHRRCQWLVLDQHVRQRSTPTQVAAGRQSAPLLDARARSLQRSSSRAARQHRFRWSQCFARTTHQKVNEIVPRRPEVPGQVRRRTVRWGMRLSVFDQITVGLCV